MIYIINFVDCHINDEYKNFICKIDYDISPTSFKLLIDNLNEIDKFKKDINIELITKYQCIEYLSKIVIKSLLFNNNENFAKILELNDEINFNYIVSNIKLTY